MFGSRFSKLLVRRCYRIPRVDAPAFAARRAPGAALHDDAGETSGALTDGMRAERARGTRTPLGLFERVLQLAHVLGRQPAAHFTERPSGLMQFERAAREVDTDEAHAG